MGWVDDVELAKRPKRLPVVFTWEETEAVPGRLRGEASLWRRRSTGRGCG